MRRIHGGQSGQGGVAGGGDGNFGSGPDRTSPPGEVSADASLADHYAKLREEFAGLEEICRWQWNVVRRLHDRLKLLPDRWPVQDAG